MAIPVLMPRQGNTVETCLINEWKKKKGESVKQGEVLCVVETDKASFEVEAPAGGVVLETFFEEGVLVPVLTNIAVIGEEGEDYEQFRPDRGNPAEPAAADVMQDEPGAGEGELSRGSGPSTMDAEILSRGRPGGSSTITISARARRLAERKGIPIISISGTGPGGRIIERDVLQAAGQQQPLTPAAMDTVAARGGRPPIMGSGIGGRVLGADIQGLEAVSFPGGRAVQEDGVTEIPMTGIRRIIADRMLASLQTTAQLTMNASADASGLLSYREKLKMSPEGYGLREVTINALLLFGVSRALARHRDLNAVFTGEKILQYTNVHLAFAVDTPKGLIVPVIRDAHALGLKEIADEAKRLSRACMEGGINPDELSGGTFTVSNLGRMGIESFTPVLNAPQVAILGVSGINLKPVQAEGQVSFIPHIGLSLTINHQVVDGAPAARFLQDLCQTISHIELTLAL